MNANSGISELLSKDLIDPKDLLAEYEEFKDTREGLNADGIMDGSIELAVALQKHYTVDEIVAVVAIGWHLNDLENLRIKGETLINEDYFEAYVEQLAYDVAPELESLTSWPERHFKLDVEAAAEEERQDYAEIEIDGVILLYRA